MASSAAAEAPTDYHKPEPTMTPANTSTTSETPIEPTPITSNGVTTKVAPTEPAGEPKPIKTVKKPKSKKQKKLEENRKKKLHKGSKKVSKGKKKAVESSDSDSSDSSDDEDELSDSSASSSDSSDSDSSETEDEKRSKRKKKSKSKKVKVSLKKKKSRSKKSRRYESDSSSSDSDSDSDTDSESDSKKKGKRHGKKHGKAPKSDPEDTTVGAVSDATPIIPPPAIVDILSQPNDTSTLQQIRNLLNVSSSPPPPGTSIIPLREPIAIDSADSGSNSKSRDKKDKKGKKHRKEKLEFKRVDQIWDNTIHDYKLQETAKEQPDEFDNCVFTVRRQFNWENKYSHTGVDIKSKYLRDALKEVMKDVKSISLVENEPSIDPNVLFLYIEEMRKYYKKTLKSQIKKARKRRAKKRLETIRTHLKLLLKYLDQDYEDVKKTLFPMLKAGNITYDLLWAIFKPNTFAYSSTYSAEDQPRCYLIEAGFHEKDFMQREYYALDGRYLEYDGKDFGLGYLSASIDHFKGPKKITSLPTYPLQYHKDPEGIKKQLIERGKKFVSLAGMNYKFMKGLAFQKRKKSMAKFNINGRVMIDPKTFRRINANYRVSNVRNPPGEDEEEDESGSDASSGDDSDIEEEVGLESGLGTKPKFRVVFDEKNRPQVVEIQSEEELSDEEVQEDIKQLPNGTSGDQDDKGFKKRDFTEEELLIASPVVLGFSFTEKDWFEFSLSGISDIEWNESAFESLVLPATHKDIVKAQVSSHKFHAAETIDDVIQGKGKGLVFVLHGPPGVGKTLTAEGIAEYLKCPLYAVSAGDLGTDARMEHELNKIMDIAHSWGAVLLLDEADVFLEKRQHQDVHRNALVSIFLRLLEYFQGILFLTTNRVETFDEAFQSRIHIALKYSELTMRAKREIWQMFINNVKAMGSSVSTFKEAQWDQLAKYELNGRQIKNMVKSAQALAMYEKQPLGMEHIKRVLTVAESFNRDLKGGTGFEEAMRSYN